jgi:predicted RNA binding protein YcfA (HicA-like mRNA interferase family)
MKLPRNLTGAQLIKALDQLDCQPTRQAGSHVRLTCHSPKNITLPYRCMIPCASVRRPRSLPMWPHIAVRRKIYCSSSNLGNN